MYRFCPIYNFWRPWARNTDLADRVHRLYARAYTRHAYKGGTISRGRALRRHVKLVFNSFLWPVALVLSALRHTGEFGRSVKGRSGKGRLRQFTEQIRLGMLYSIPPRSYYWFRIFDESNRERAKEFLHYHENNYLLAPAGPMDDQRKVCNKEEFAAWCHRLDLPTVPLIAHFPRDDAVSEDLPIIELPPRSLLAKPAKGGEGRGVLAWEYDGAGNYIDKDDNILTRCRLHDELIRLSRVESYIVQPKLQNHPEIADLSMGGLCTARIVTSRLPGKSPVLVLSAFKMPGGRQIVDNFSYNGVACGVDPRTGELIGSATHKHPGSQLFAAHPDTGGLITGRKLPDWDRVVDACLRAHQELADYPGIGWDVGFTPDGPVLIEGNVPLGFELAQIATNLPLGDTPFAEAVLGYAERIT